MHFYIDESGHTGPNLFDPNQPMLYYGLLSSKLNVDALAAGPLQTLRKKLGVSRLHATELGNEGLVEIAADLSKIQSNCDLHFDISRVAKPDHAIVSFFDQIFDSFMNPAMTYSGYWTPIRYVLLLKLAYLFDESLAKLAWEARLELNDQKSGALLIQVCEELIKRVPSLPDTRSIELITDTLRWAADNPDEISYNASNKKNRLAIMPNVIGFQFVLAGIINRLNKTKQKASRIVVDQQSQFNKSQNNLAEYYKAISSAPASLGPGMPKLDLRGMPVIPIEFLSSNDSPGLELTDIYLWIYRRIMEQGVLAPELLGLTQPLWKRSQWEELSLKGLEKRWTHFFMNLPEPTQEQLEQGRDLVAFDEARRRKAIGKDD